MPHRFHDFELDPFQEQAVSAINEGHSVFVSAPTGSGKTVIAEYAIENALQSGKEIIYTAPIKALSNQKYRDFRKRFGDEKVGILTGDVSINKEAPILIMTTEIYRNCLFQSPERIAKIGWVIFDEIHYLDDYERGTVWEESLLFTPEHIRILALSATAPNVKELADWVRSIHRREITVIEDFHRPVPLRFLFQCQGKILPDMTQLKKDGYLLRENWKLSPREKRQGMMHMRARPNRLDHLLKELSERKHLPMIYFAFGRRRTETLAWEAAQFDFVKDDALRKEIMRKYNALLDQYDIRHEKSAEDMSHLVVQGIAYHHAGMLPTLKEVIEQLFTERLVKVIFTTETFALGINMPARSVIFDELEKFYGTGFQFLTTRDFYQMAGRAGRRGMDTEGSVYIRINPQNIPYREVERILYGKPELIRSQLNTAYATLLHLYQQFGKRLFDLYPKSFHCFRSPDFLKKKAVQLIDGKLMLLRWLNHIDDQGLTAKGEFASSLFGYELLLSEIHEAGILEDLDVTNLCVLLSALIYEPRKGDVSPRTKGFHNHLRNLAEKHALHIHRKEAKLKIRPYTKLPHFHLAEAMAAWAQGETFDRVFRWTSADEGEFVRYVRMVIQLLRELVHAPHVSEKVKATAYKARERINRDVVDAEKQLRA